MSVISISEVKCKDCYKCVRACPMKAIKIESGHAHIIEERCISDGHCLNVCPQGAKRVASDLDRVKEWLRSGLAVGASIAPSFPAFFGIDSATYLVRALKAKGFKLVQETSVGAEFVAREHRRLISIAPYSADGRRLPLLSSSCPAVINLIEKHYPEVISQVAPVVSPMVAHGKYMKSIAGRPDKVVFIGPCVAKRDELGRECNTIGKEAAVDAVLSFPEVEKWLGMDLCGSQEQGGDTAITDAAITEEGTIAKRLSRGPVSGGPLSGGPDDLKNVKKIGCFDGPLPCWAKTFPVTGGLLKTAALDTDMTSEDVLTVCGVTECKELLEEIRSKDGFARYFNKTKLIELMACPGGCISGPHMKGGVSAVLRRALVLGYAVPGSSEEFWDREYEERGLDLSVAFSNRCVSYP
ncbi:MAG TPA: 4Fe-4S dicluster domain-containing protein, partial [Clostridia bacterium]|nr:4Fe-4S dicluster domain-containing protein [Clostridia bacterium]